ncbi:TPA: hypothetical protein DIC20_00230 [Candidatus Dependentiae bacterium]|nr:hypothetical protein [Candidatus Dependentiae bacterium]
MKETDIKVRTNNLAIPIDSFYNPIIILTQTFTIYKINAAALKLYGWTEEAVLEISIFKLCEQDSNLLPLPSNIQTYLEQGVPVIWKSIIKKDAIKIIAEWEIKKFGRGLYLLTAFNTGLYITDTDGIEHSIKKALLELIKNTIKSTALDVLLRSPNQKSQEDLKGILSDIVNMLPGQVYWTNVHGIYLGCNELVAELYGLSSHHDLIGQTAYFIERIMNGHISSSLARSWEETNNKIIITGEPLLFYHDPIFHPYDHEEKVIKPITNKVPLINRYGERIGVFGITIDENDQSQLMKLMDLYKQFILPSSAFSNENQDIEQKLTSRERECFALIAKGLTAKTIARKLEIAERTAEVHIHNIKRKLCCYSKVQLAEIYWKSQSSTE